MEEWGGGGWEADAAGGANIAANNSFHFSKGNEKKSNYWYLKYSLTALLETIKNTQLLLL